MNGLTSLVRINVFHAQLVDCGPGKTAKWCVWQSKNVICAVFDFFELALAPDDSRVGRKLVMGVSEV